MGENEVHAFEQSNLKRWDFKDINMIDWNDFFHYMFYEDFNFLWLLNVCVWLILSVFIVKKSKILNLLENTKRLYRKYAFFFASYAVSKCLFFFSNYYYDRRDVFGIVPEEAIILRIGYAINLISVGVLVLGLERDLLDWKGFVAGIVFINVIIVIFANESIYKTATLYLQVIYFVTIALAYIIVSRKSTGDIKKYSNRTMIGMGLFFLGIFLDLRVLKQFFVDKGLETLIHIALPLINLIGTTIFFRSVPSKNEETIKGF